MSGSAVRRVLIVLLFYAAVAWVVLGGAGWLQTALALPQLFDDLLRLGLVLGVPIAMVIAWRYPHLGGGESGPSPDRR